MNATWKDIALYALALALSLYTVMGDTVTLAWPANPPGENVVSYRVYSGRTLPLTSWEFTDRTDLTVSVGSGTLYWFAVSAVNGELEEGPQSAPVSYLSGGEAPVPWVVETWVAGSVAGPWGLVAANCWTSAAGAAFFRVRAVRMDGK